jgi:hypothetical protein
VRTDAALGEGIVIPLDIAGLAQAGESETLEL